MATTTIVSNTDVDFYFTSVNAAFRRALAGQNRAIFPRFCYVVPSGTSQETKVPIDLPDGRSAMGTRVKFPINISASPWQVWPFGTPRPYEPIGLLSVEVDLKRYTLPAKREFFDVLDSDLFGIVKAQLPEMMDRSVIMWDKVAADTIVANETWTGDGIAFFTPSGTPHEANPNKKGVANFYNDVPITAIDPPNMRMLMGLLENMPGPDGLPLDTDSVEIVNLVPNADHELQSLQVFQAAIAAQPVGANAAAGVSNMLAGRASVVLFKQLARTKSAPIFGGKAQDRGKVGYLMAVPKVEGRPIALVPKRHPTAYYTGLNSSDHLRATEGAIEFGVDAYGAAKLVVPQRILRYVVNPV